MEEDLRTGSRIKDELDNRTKKKTILITGGSRGIGAATALLAAEKGYNVCVNYLRNESAANSVQERIRQAGGAAISIQADVTRESEVSAMFVKIDREFGKLDVLVNNAGILEKQARVEEMSLERVKRVFWSNFVSTFICSKEAIKRMAVSHGGEGGAIVNVSSIASRTGSPEEYVDYAASKGAIDTFTIGLSKEVAGEGIRVNGVRPGFIYTDIHSSGGEADRVDRIKHLIPLKRGGLPEEVANAILWLASEESSFSTGTFIDIAGGK